ncbi:MAG: hypothetical protein RL250_1271 [Verrucomicrobiota bacterium]
MRRLLALLAVGLAFAGARAQEIRGLPLEPELVVVLNLDQDFRLERSGQALYQRLIDFSRAGATQGVDPAELAATQKAWAEELGVDIHHPFRRAALSLDGLRTAVTGGPRHLVFVAEGDFRLARFQAYAGKRVIPSREIAGRTVWSYVDWIKGGASEAQRALIEDNLRRMPALANIVFFLHEDRRLVACEAGDLPTVTARADGQSPSFRFDAVTAADRAALPKPALTVQLEGRAFQAQVLGQPEKIARLTLHAGEDATDEVVRLRGDFTSEVFAQQAAGQMQAGLALVPTMLAARPDDTADDARMKTALRALAQATTPVLRQDKTVTVGLKIKDTTLLEILSACLEQLEKDRRTAGASTRK